MAITAFFDLEAEQVDFSNAYLNANLDEKVFARFPEGFRKPGWLLQLLKALYGLRRSGLLWQNTLCEKLQALGYRQVADESCLLQDDKSIVFFYVDDLVLLSKREHLDHLKSQKQNLLTTYEGKDLGNIHWFLNIEVIRDRAKERITLIQTSCIDKMIQKYHIKSGRKISTPLSEPGGGPGPSQEKFDPQFPHFFQSIIGSLIYIAIISRPDIAFAVNVLARHMSNPNDEHLMEAKRVLSYLEATKYHGLSYGNGLDSTHMHVASDAAFADDEEHRRVHVQAFWRSD